MNSCGSKPFRWCTVAFWWPQDRFYVQFTCSAVVICHNSNSMIPNTKPSQMAQMGGPALSWVFFSLKALTDLKEAKSKGRNLSSTGCVKLGIFSLKPWRSSKRLAAWLAHPTGRMDVELACDGIFKKWLRTSSSWKCSAQKTLCWSFLNQNPRLQHCYDQWFIKHEAQGFHLYTYSIRLFGASSSPSFAFKLLYYAIIFYL